MIGYLFFGTMVFTSSFSDNAYLDIIFSVLNNKTFLVIFVYPSFLFLWYMVIQYTMNDYTHIVRWKDSWRYLLNIIKQLIKTTIMIYFQYLLFQLISVNMTSHTPFDFSSNLNYNVNDFIVYLVCIFRSILNLIIFSIFTLFLFIKTHKNGLAIGVLFLILMIIYFGDRLYYISNPIMNIFNLGFQAYGYDIANNILYLLCSNLIFFSLSLVLLLFSLLKIAKKIDFGVKI